MRKFVLRKFVFFAVFTGALVLLVHLTFYHELTIFVSTAARGTRDIVDDVHNDQQQNTHVPVKSIKPLVVAMAVGYDLPVFKGFLLSLRTVYMDDVVLIVRDPSAAVSSIHIRESEVVAGSLTHQVRPCRTQLHERINSLTPLSNATAVEKFHFPFKRKNESHSLFRRRTLKSSLRFKKSHYSIIPEWFVTFVPEVSLRLSPCRISGELPSRLFQ